MLIDKITLERELSIMLKFKNLRNFYNFYLNMVPKDLNLQRKNNLLISFHKWILSISNTIQRKI